MHARLSADQYLDTVLDALRGDSGAHALIDQLPVPVYTTDAEGRVTYWNRACVDFAGREPELGSDRWCVTWRIYTTSGDALPHDQCPMAEAIRQQREIRGKVAIVMRPDGSRRAFIPYPTPLFDESGALSGAVNMMIDVSAEQAGALAEQSTRCRRLAMATTDREVSQMLIRMADGYEETAAALRTA